jgi:hypothetical protein
MAISGTDRASGGGEYCTAPGMSRSGCMVGVSPTAYRDLSPGNVIDAPGPSGAVLSPFGAIELT